VHLLDSADRERTDFNKGETAEVLRLQNIDLTVISKKDVVLMLQRMLVDRPERTAQPTAARIGISNRARDLRR
jgi:hypothetical protein